MNATGISAVIPVFNGAPFIAEAIHSVIAQGESIAEVIVVDDGSTDGSGDTAASFPAVRMLRQANRGIGAARNAGVAAARAPFLAFLDADDLWPAGRCQALLEAFRGDPSLDLVVGTAVEFGEGRVDTAPAHAPLAGGMLVRRSSFERVGTFREDVKVGEFIDWWARAQELGVRVAQIPDVVLRRRIHTSNTGIVQAGSRVDYARVLRAALERRRGVN